MVCPPEMRAALLDRLNSDGGHFSDCRVTHSLLYKQNCSDMTMSRADREEMFRRFREANPTPQTELEYGSTFQLLIAVLLSAQATDRSVNMATKELFAKYPTPEAMLELGEEGVAEHIKTIGLYRTKARNVIATCKILVEQYGGEVPDTREALESLPGVGRKTANVVLNTAFRQPTMAVDTHIFRVANRTGLAPGKNVRQVEEALLKRVPKEYLLDAHHWLILHGRYICLARTPRCPECAISDLCRYKNKTTLHPRTTSATRKSPGKPTASKKSTAKTAAKSSQANKAPTRRGIVRGSTSSAQDAATADRASAVNVRPETAVQSVD